MQFLIIDDGAKIIFLVKSHHHQFFPNVQFLDLRKKLFSYLLEIKTSKYLFS